MKAKIRETGEIVNIASYCKITLDKCNSRGDPIEVDPEEIELIQEPTEDEHWQDVRVRAAIAAMQGFCSNTQTYMDDDDDIANWAIKQADILIEELKKN